LVSVSVAPPARNPTITLIGFSGNSARAGMVNAVAASVSAITVRVPNRLQDIVFSTAVPRYIFQAACF
jgi:hypothetical protein